ncbi:MAG: hypothetical protein WBP85_07050 [Terracidiphilus sp.]
MNWREDLTGENPELEQALKHFKASMDAWSDAALSRPRMVANVAARPAVGWRLAASWAMGCLLAAGSLTIAVHQFAHRQQAASHSAQKTAQKTAEQQGTAEPVSASAPAQNSATMAVPVKQQAGAEDEDLLASVDKDVSQQVPAALEPLAQLMDNDGTQ